MASGASIAAVEVVRDVLRNSAIRRIEIAWIAGWLQTERFSSSSSRRGVQAGGALAAGILGAIRVVPWIVSAPFAPQLVLRFRGDRVLAAVNAARSLGAVATTVVVAADLPLEVTYALAAVVAGAGSLVGWEIRELTATTSTRREASNCLSRERSSW